jgi:hypothetical protein
MTEKKRANDPIVNIRDTCGRVVRDAKFVSIDDSAIEALADDLIRRELVQVGKAFSGVEWDSCGKMTDLFFLLS